MVRRTKEDAEQTRRQILEATEKAFYERGVAGTTLADIAMIAGVSRGAIYWHFHNKADLLQCLLASRQEPLSEIKKDDSLKEMRALLINFLKEVSTNPKTQRLNEIFFHKLEQTNELLNLRAQRQHSLTTSHHHIQYALKNAIRLQQAPSNLNTALCAIYINSYINGIVAQWLLAPESFSLYETAEALVDIAVDMLKFSPTLCLRKNTEVTPRLISPLPSNSVTATSLPNKDTL
ncbi:HTH-type transcriptional regulator TtgR [Pseudomonas fluorescens]|nr:HTH-type transcriptional regulator TtgR [Pseudomonas fluorescens]